jgi:hypothetical protein
MTGKIKHGNMQIPHIVVLIIFNPEMAELAIFIDAIGLEMFLMLLEVQVLVILGSFYARLKAIFTYLRKVKQYNNLEVWWLNIIDKPESLLLLVPSQAALMSLLVLTAMMDTVYKYIV